MRGYFVAVSLAKWNEIEGAPCCGWILLVVAANGRILHVKHSFANSKAFAYCILVVELQLWYGPAELVNERTLADDDISSHATLHHGVFECLTSVNSVDTVLNMLKNNLSGSEALMDKWSEALLLTRTAKPISIWEFETTHQTMCVEDRMTRGCGGGVHDDDICTFFVWGLGYHVFRENEIITIILFKMPIILLNAMSHVE